MNKPVILIISNKFDFTTDYVCLELQARKTPYLRLNRDEFDQYRVTFDVNSGSITVEITGELFFFDEGTLIAVYYRAPAFLRDIYKPNLPKEEQLYRTQWTAFIKNLVFFEKILWVNNPVTTYKAENKLLQLKYAQKAGLPCPATVVTNNNDIGLEGEKNYIVKSLDTGILRIDDREAFIYSNVVTGDEVKASDLKLSPVILQEYMYPKTDVRVTVAGSKIYAVRILKDNQGIDGDWRREKNSVEFVPFTLPEDILSGCITLVNSLGLAFGAIDLIETNGTFYFLEINPTGEWAWLVDSAGLKIYEGICDCLEGKI